MAGLAPQRACLFASLVLVVVVTLRGGAGITLASLESAISLANLPRKSAPAVRCKSSGKGSLGPFACVFDDACLQINGSDVRILSSLPQSLLPREPIVASASGYPTVHLHGGFDVSSHPMSPSNVILHMICCTGHIAHHLFDDMLPMVALAELSPAAQPHEALLVQPLGSERFWHPSLADLVATAEDSSLRAGEVKCFRSIRAGSAFGLWSNSIRRQTAQPLRRRVANLYRLRDEWPLPTRNALPVLTIIQRESRPITNLGAVEAMGRRMGFNTTVLWPRKVTFEYQIAQSARSDVLLYVHGAALVNMLFMGPGTKVITVFPYRNFDSVYGMHVQLADAFQLQHRIIRVRKGGSSPRQEVLDEHPSCRGEKSPNADLERLRADSMRTLRSHYCPGAYCLCETQYWNDQRVQVPLDQLANLLDDHLAERAALRLSLQWDPVGQMETA